LIIPVKTSILKESWRLLEEHHLYEADAIQIATAKHIKAQEFLTSDKKLYESALAEGLKTVIVD